ncbi:MAG: TRAP transporter substrate-binding protein [Lautropia sp.]
MRSAVASVCKALVASVCLAGSVTVSTAWAVTEFKFPHVGTPSSSYHQAATKFAELVAAKSKGDLKVTVIPGGQMGDQQDLLAGLRLGTIDFYTNDVGTMAFQDSGKDFNVLWAPYVFRDMVHFRAYLKSPTYRQMVETYEAKSGIKVVGYLLDRSPRQLTTAKTAVRTPADMKGLKIRIPQIQTMLASFSAWGANPTIMPWIETINALRHGTVDAQDNGIDLITAFKLWESQKYYIQTDHVLAGIVLFTSAAKWKRWSPETRRIIEESVQGTYAALNDKFWEDERKGLKDMEANQMTIIKPDQAAFRKIAMEEMRKLDGTLWRKGLLDEIDRIK